MGGGRRHFAEALRVKNSEGTEHQHDCIVTAEREGGGGEKRPETSIANREGWRLSQRREQTSILL